MSNSIVKTYWSYQEMVVDLASLTDKIDVNKTLFRAPPLCFYKTDGSVILGGSLIHFLQRFRDETGVKVNPLAPG